MQNMLTAAITDGFVYLISKFQVVADVDALILAVWKLMKYSSVKASVFGAAQTVEGLKT